MIDSKVFNELINHGIITHVGLNPENYKDIADLHKYGLSTRVDAAELYEELMSELVNTETADAEDVKDTEDTNGAEDTEGTDDVKDVKDTEDTEGESKDIIVDDNAE